MKKDVEELLEDARNPVCGLSEREAVKDRVLAGLQPEPDSGRRQRRREERRQADDRAIILGKLTRRARVKRTLLVPILGLLLLTILTAGAYGMSADKNPDSMLYPVKLFFEQARLKLTGSDLARAELEMDYANTRIAELDFMVSHHISKGAQYWVAGYEENLRETLDFCSRLEGDAASSINARVNGLAQRHREILSAFSSEAPAELSPIIEEARGACNVIESSLTIQIVQVDTASDSPSDLAPAPPGDASETSVPPGQAGSTPAESKHHDRDGGGDGDVPGHSDDSQGEKGGLHPCDPQYLQDYDSSWMEWPGAGAWWDSPLFQQASWDCWY